MNCCNSPLRFLLWPVTALALQGCIPDYAPDFRARLVDSDTDQPVEGAIVVAHWEILGGLEGLNPVGQAKVMEAVTDKNGVISFPSWWRIPRELGGIQNARPELLIFKDGYKYIRLANETRPTFMDELVLRSDWNGRTLKLERFKGSQQAYAKELARLDSAMYFARWTGNCEWKRTPRMLVALDRANAEFASMGLELAPRTIHSAADVDDTKQCGSARQFFSEYLPSETNK